ncbi:ABC transporter permease [Pseudonocardia xinjiangensis]|uniref:Transport permease protein n=1 Tax=Pseudonocardia xinjiangensis TaxID=75289 RepID=A0ABX1R909_9PSEU|nr:ABC transporter permease [Pseudonocardia xinjiangensis]NMH76154.1 ABC transporter permease [Pseudonocardia xinjiangensis]
MVTTDVSTPVPTAPRVSAARVGAVLEYFFTYSFRTREALTLLGVIWLTAVTEPVLYLLAMGLGVGSLIDSTIPVDSHQLSYIQFVAPAMLAVSCMSGAISASIFSFYTRHRHLGMFTMISTAAVSPAEVVVADWLWEIIRVTMLSAIFVAVMVVAGVVGVGNALVAFVATILVIAAFAAVGIGLSTLLRGWQDFDIITVAQTVLFLFSGTFFPIQQYPEWLQVIVQLSPLYQSIALLRALTIGDFGMALVVPIGYLLLMVVAGLLFSVRRLGRDLGR